MGGDELTPWWVAIGAGICSALLGAIGKLWSENKSLRKELAEANDKIVDAQTAAAARADAHQSEHRRDLRRLAGLSTSVDPPPFNPAFPPVVIREARPTRARAPKKREGE